MITRLSKIARLPAKIREQLNHRLHDGQLSNHILPWVNSLPETQEILAELFNSKPITHQNLSEWRRAGYQDWLFHQQRLDWFSHLTEQSRDIKKHDGSPDTFETMGNIFLFEIAQAIHVMKATQDPNQRCDRLQTLIREFTRLQNAYNFSRRIELDYVKHNGTRADNGTGVSPVSSLLGPPAPVAPKSDEGGSRRPGPLAPQPSEPTEYRKESPSTGGASPSARTVLASRAPHETAAPELPEPAVESDLTPKRQRAGALQDAPRNPEAQDQRASVLDCGSPLPLSEAATNQQSTINSQPIPPLAPTPTHPQIPHPNIQPPALPRPYKPHANPIRGRRFTCIEG